MSMQISKWSKLSGLGLFGLMASWSACADSPSGVSQQADNAQVDTLSAALENPVLKCEQDQRTCRSAAKDPMAARSCDDTLRTCLGDAAKQGEQVAMDIEQCRTTAAECVTKGGPTGVMSCRADYDKCVEGVTGAPSQPSAAGGPSLPQLPSAGRRAPRLPIGGGLAFPGRPNFPQAGGPGGLTPRFPRAGAPALPQAGRASLPRGPRAETDARKCFADLRECVRAPGKDPNTCAADARKCLESPARGAAGAGAAAGAGGAGGAGAGGTGN